MALVNPINEPPKRVEADGNEAELLKQKPPKVEPGKFESITVDTNYVPSSKMLAWVEGSSWTVNYYSQKLGKDNVPQPQSLDRDAAWQQYRLVRNLDIRVTTPLSFNQEERTRTMEVRGSAVTLPFLVPNQGDMFIADVGDGRTGVFTVTSSRRNTILKDSVYTIDYEMVDYATEERIADFRRKTVETYNFSRRSLQSGNGPLLTDPQADRAERYQRLTKQLLGRYLQDFWTPEQQTLLVPDQQDKTYDHFVVQFLMALLDTQDHPLLRRIRQQNVSGMRVLKEPTVWDAILRQDASYLHFSTQRTYLLSRRWLKSRPELRSFAYSGIPYLVFPLETASDVQSIYDNDDLINRTGIEMQMGGHRQQAIGQIERNNAGEGPQLDWLTPADNTDPGRLPPDYHPVASDQYYVFSKAFYFDVTDEQSKVEVLVRQTLSGQQLNLRQLDYLLEGIWHWPNLERFYYYPVILALLRKALWSF